MSKTRKTIWDDWNAPSKVLGWIQRLLPWSLFLCFILSCLGLWFALVQSPADYQQGETVRIMYIHVPSSWGAMAVYTSMAALAGIAFVKRWTLGHLLMKALAPVGVTFTTISLLTGAIWGKPTWGTWWVWDARLTSMLLLWILYAGYWALIHAFDDEEKGLISGSLLILMGVVNLPIIKWSVTWWNTLHQPASIMRIGKPAIHSSMLTPLLLMACALAVFGFSLFLMRLRVDLMQRRLNSLERRYNLH